MEPLKSTTARLRRTFRYPTDDSTDLSSTAATPEALDEEEQEHLITSLAQQNETRNAQFRYLLFALPTLASIPYLVSLLSSTFSNNHHTRPQQALLALTSLASTAWLLYYLPPEETGVGWLDSLSSTRQQQQLRNGLPRTPRGNEDEEEEDDDDATTLRRSRTRRRRASSFSLPTGYSAMSHRTPLQRWLPYLNLVLCGVLVVIGILKSSGARNGTRDSLVVDLLPAVVYAVILAAKMVMGGVDPEGELEGLRYEFKGA